MTNSLYTQILLIETIIFTIGFGLLIYELKVLSPVIRQKTTWSLCGILVSTNFVYLTRALGIYYERTTLRQFGPVLSAFIGTLFLIYWGASMTNLSTNWTIISYAFVSLGTIIFLIGRSYGINQLSILGAVFLGGVPITMLIHLYRFVFYKTAYIRARQRIFLMALAFTIMIIGDTLGAIFMGLDNFTGAAISFSIELPARFLMMLSIVLPIKLQSFLNRFIK